MGLNTGKVSLTPLNTTFTFTDLDGVSSLHEKIDKEKIKMRQYTGYLKKGVVFMLFNITKLSEFLKLSPVHIFVSFTIQE